MFYSFIFALHVLMFMPVDHAGHFNISKELDEVLTLKPIPEHLFEDNAYVGWMGFGYPESSWQVVYKEFFQKNDELFNEQIMSGSTVVQNIADPMKKKVEHLVKIGLIHSSNALYESEIQLLSDQLMKEKKFFVFRQQPYDGSKYINNHSFFACGSYVHHDCIDQIKNRKDYIDVTIHKNQILLDRFRVLAKESKFNIALYFNDIRASTVMMPRAPMSRIFQLHLSESILQLLDGHMDEGIDNLVLARRWLDLTYDFESRPTVFQFIMNILYTQYLDQAMDAILDEGLLAGYLDDPRVEFIMSLYPKDIGVAVNTALLWDIEQTFKGVAYPYLKVYIEEPTKLRLSDEDELIALNFFKSKGLFLPNNLFERYQELLSKQQSGRGAKIQELYSLSSALHDPDEDTTWITVQLMLEGSEETENYEQWYNKFFFDLNATPKTILNYLNYTYPSTEYYENYYESIKIIKEHQTEYLSVKRLDELLGAKLQPKYFEMIKNFRAYDSFEQYWNRVYEQQNYHQLVYLKYLIIKNHIPVEDIPQFLESMGDDAKNTLTHEPYHFDFKTMLLSTPLPEDKRKLPVNIRDAYMDDHSIENFEVQLPKY